MCHTHPCQYLNTLVSQHTSLPTPRARLCLQRKSLVQGLTASNCEALLKQPFRCPHPSLKGTTGFSRELKRSLRARNKFIPWGDGKHDGVFRPKFTPPSAHTAQEVPQPQQGLSAEVEPLGVFVDTWYCE